MDQPDPREADTPIPYSVDPAVRRMQSDWRELRRETSELRVELRELRGAYRATEAALDALRTSYPVVAGMTSAQRKGAIAGAGGAAIAIAAVLPQIIEALRPLWQH